VASTEFLSLQKHYAASSYRQHSRQTQRAPLEWPRNASAYAGCGLTLPSRGRFPAYGLQAPLMSNVRPRVKTASTRCLPLGALHAPSRKAGMQVAAGAWGFYASAQGQSHGRLGLSVLRRPAHGRSVSDARTAGPILQHRLSPRTEPRPKSLSCPVKGRQRRPRTLVQPRSPRSIHGSGTHPTAPALVCFAIQMQSKVLARRAWPNPSIEGTASGLRPPAAPHVKR
jgi:hypothetical protein